MDQNIAVTNVVTKSVTGVTFGEDAKFCHACVTGGYKWGDSCWGLTVADDPNRQCGCNSGSWAGNGIYYGGESSPDVCAEWSGGFTGAHQLNLHMFQGLVAYIYVYYCPHV